MLHGDQWPVIIRNCGKSLVASFGQFCTQSFRYAAVPRRESLYELKLALNCIDYSLPIGVDAPNIVPETAILHFLDLLA